jgi:hypothetical protein
MIRNHIRLTPTQAGRNHVGLSLCPLKGATNGDEPWHSAVGTVLFSLRNLDITGPGLKVNCTDGFQRQCHPLLADWVGDYPEQVMIAPVSNCSCPLCKIPKDTLMGHSMLQLFDITRDQPVCFEL